MTLLPDAITQPQRLLLFGATGLVGGDVLALASAAGHRVDAVSRSMPIPGQPTAVRWHAGPAWDLSSGAGPWPDAVDVILSAGPLDALASWLERVRPTSAHRLVALSSTSVVTKVASPDPAERALVERLARAEERVIAVCERAGVAWTLLRPTLIWGANRDRNVSRLARVARRFGVIPLPSFAVGRRQPIRAVDVAGSLLAAIPRTESVARRLDLPGGDILRYDEMARRIAAAVSPPGRVLRVHGGAMMAAARAAAFVGIARHAAAAMERTRVDLVFDGDPAREALAYTPAGFEPSAADFPLT